MYLSLEPNIRCKEEKIDLHFTDMVRRLYLFEAYMKNNLALSILGFVISLVLCFTIDTFASTDKEQLAVAAAESWLKIIDQGRYADSYTSTSSYFKSKVELANWEKSVKEARQPLGKLLARKIKSKQYTKQLPGAPDGEYVVIQFETSFEKKKSTTETITPALDKDGKWKVSGYFIRWEK